MSKYDITCTAEKDCPCHFCEKSRKRPPDHPAQFDLILALTDAINAAEELADESEDSLPECVGADAEGIIYTLEMYRTSIECQTRGGVRYNDKEVIEELRKRKMEREALEDEDDEEADEAAAVTPQVTVAPPSTVNTQNATAPRKRNYWEPEPDVV